MIFESRRTPLLPRRLFVLRLLRHAAISSGLVVFSLGIGMLGYHFFAGLSWLDATLNAAMILTGMGPINPLETPAAKTFAIFYCLFSGVAFLTMVAIIFAPIFHRFLHRFHLDLEDSQSDNVGDQR